MAADSNSDNPLDQLRLSLMQDVLPVGLAVLERARKGGPGKVVEVFTAGSEDPIATCAKRVSRWPVTYGNSWML